ncbi:MAG: hypothetical protein SGARI_000966 [Bacillariaceae sp.]
MAGLPRELAYSADQVKPPQDEYRMTLIKNADVQAELLNGWTLFKHQKKAIIRALTMRRMILALDMGLGKTLIGAVWAKAFKKTFDNLKVFVVCPSTLKEEWQRTAQDKVGLKVEAEKTRSKKANAVAEDDDGLSLQICSWAKVPKEVGTDANAKNLGDEAVLGAVQRLRMVCAFAKIDATVDLSRKILNEQPAIVIFSSFAQVAKELHEKISSSGWPCDLLTGDTPQKKRQGLVDRFQDGLSSVFVCTYGAGGVGLTLTAASTIVLLDRPWTPGETRQAEDRIRRIGQDKDCTSYWMRSFELDKQIDEVLASKNQTANAVLNKSAAGGAIAGPAAKISITKLVQSFLLSNKRQQL